MENKKKTLISIIIFCLLMSILAFLFIQKKSTPSNSNNSSEYKNIITRMNNKETFNVLFTKDKNEDTTKAFDYYKEAYKLEYDHVSIDFNDKYFKELIEKSTIKIEKSTKNIFFIIKNGVVYYSFMGEMSESNLKMFLIKNNIIDKEYEKVDTVIGSDFKDYYNDNNIYYILYINLKNKDLYNYRKVLVENKVKSFIMYTGSANQAETEKYFKEKLGFGHNIEEKLPILIKMQKKNIISSKFNITLDSIKEEVSKNK